MAERVSIREHISFLRPDGRDARRAPQERRTVEMNFDPQQAGASPVGRAWTRRLAVEMNSDLPGSRARPRATRTRLPGAGCLALIALCLVASGGCTLLGQWRSASSTAGPTQTSGGHSSAGTVQTYLDTMDGLASPDPARQADVFYEVEREYTRAPTTASTLRYAVARVTPGHPGSDPVEGKRLLETLLATPERLTQEERTLASVLLHETNTRLKLVAENRRLSETLDDRSRSQANSDKRVQAQIEENARLRRALAEAQHKLDAIKEIERSIIERSPTPPGGRNATDPN